METIKEELVAGGKVQLVGFGTFEVRDRKERQGRNPNGDLFPESPATPNNINGERDSSAEVAELGF